MKLSAYLKSDGALTVRALADAIGCAPAQVWQWVAAEQAEADKRQPGAAYCSAIQAATNGAVMRWDLRPNDWYRIWPEMIGTEGAPDVHAASDTKEAA